VGANTTRYTDKNVPANALYYYRVRAQIGLMRSGFSNEVNAVLGYATIAMSNNTMSSCQAVFVDQGGYENYPNNTKSTMTFSPSTPGSKLRVTFSAFDLESNYDYLIVYDGANINAPFIGKYSGTSLPPAITATNAAGQLTFFFVSDEIINKSGWVATLSCIGGATPTPAISSFSPESGIPGQSIVINGVNFNGVTAVKFNDIPADFTINSNTQITAIVPATASKGNISISTASGTQQSITSFTVTPIISVSSLTFTYDGTPKAVQVSTIPANLPVIITYNGSSALPVNSGTYTVAASISDPSYTGSIQANLVIKKASAAILFGQLEQSFTGQAKPVTIATVPAGLAVNVTYNTAEAAPIGAGSYQVTGVVTDANYEGRATTNLVISKAQQTITFEAFGDKTFGDAAFALTAKSNSQLPVSFTVVKGSAVIVNNVVNLTGAGQVTIRASQSGNENFQEATMIERTMCVKPAKPAITSSNSNTGSLFTLTSSSAQGNEWLLNGELIAGATGQTYQVTKPGRYAVRVSVETCENSSDELVLTGEIAIVLASTIQVYPNPASDRIAVQVSSLHGAGECVATVYNILGEKVAQKVLDAQSEGWQAEFAIAHLAAGRYLMQITNGQQKCTKTFIKQ
jgi:hypothetical protein